jgi:hypothetical protein
VQRFLPAHFSDLMSGRMDFASAALTAGVYLVVHGCDSIEKGWSEPKRLDRVVSRAHGLLASRLTAVDDDVPPAEVGEEPQ